MAGAKQARAGFPVGRKSHLKRGSSAVQEAAVWRPFLHDLSGVPSVRTFIKPLAAARDECQNRDTGALSIPERISGLRKSEFQRHYWRYCSQAKASIFSKASVW